MGKRVLLTGGVTLANKGTAAIITQTIESLRNFLPHSRISVELFYPERQRKIMEIEGRNVEIVAPPIQHPIRGMLLLLLAAFFSVLRKLHINLDIKIKTLRRFREADIIVDISAEAFTNFYGESIFSRTFRYLLHLPSILICIFLNKPLVFYAQTLAPFGVFRPIMKYVLSRASLVTVRDPTSLYNLKKEGVDISNVYVTADPGFLLKSSSKSRVAKILREEGIRLAQIRKEEKPIIGVVAGRNIGRIMRSYEYAAFIKVIADVVNELIKNLNAILIFIPHHSGKIRKKMMMCPLEWTSLNSHKTKKILN